MDSQAHKVRFRREFVGPIALGLLAFVLGRPALAVDGVIEINQARATAGSVTAGDTPGFPVSINAIGSYRLTGDLTVPASFEGILVNSDDVTIDLNGFDIIGGGGIVADGISLTSHKNIEIKNGTIRGFSRDGIFTNNGSQFVRVIGVRVIGNTFQGMDLQGPGNLIDGCSAFSNGSFGIGVREGSLVINSVARGNVGFGLVVSATAGYRSNVLTGNNGGDANAQVSGLGLQLGSNVCGSDLVCP